MAGDGPARRESRRFSIPLPIPGIKRRQSHYQTKTQRPRWMLHVQATFWRTLMGLGMFFHRLAPPRPPHPSFTRTIPSTVSRMPGTIALQFYTPKDYDAQRRLHFDDVPGHRHGIRHAGGHSGSLRTPLAGLRRRSFQARTWGGYPVIINFHGGGFTLGTAIDDARWCGTVVEECNAIVVSVDYRLAPEHPFPTAVEDGVDAVLWIHKHAKELGIDPTKIALSGFSSGGNMAFSVPLRLYDHLTDFSRMSTQDAPSSAPVIWEDVSYGHESSANLLPRPEASTSAASSSSDTVELREAYVDNAARAQSGGKRGHKNSSSVEEALIPDLDIKICCIVPWYPSLDYTRTREHRRETCKRADQELPAFFTDLFDDSYLHPPKDVSMDSPYLSPGVAPTGLLRDALPQEIIMHTCEWDMLLEEGEEFHKRLISPEIGKNVVYTMVPGVPHGWDKAPNPVKPTPGVREYYLNACKELRRCLAVDGTVPERDTADGPSAAPRTSKQIVR